MPGGDSPARCRLGRRRGEKFHDFHAVGIFAVAPFLDRPHGHVVAWIDAGERIISPPMGSARIGAIVRVVAGAARRENCRRIDGSQSIARQSSRFGGVKAKDCAGCAETKRCVSLTGNDHGWNPIPVGRRAGAIRIENRPRLNNCGSPRSYGHTELIPSASIPVPAWGSYSA